jgi:acyl carrier protein
MIPGRFMQLDELPLTSNCKIDKRKLIMSKNNELNSGNIYAAPDNQIEENILKLLQEVVGKNNVGTNDSLFSLGITSLAVLAFFKKIDVLYPGIFKIADLYNYSTIKELAGIVTKSLNSPVKQNEIYEEFKL